MEHDGRTKSEQAGEAPDLKHAAAEQPLPLAAEERVGFGRLLSYGLGGLTEPITTGNTVQFLNQFYNVTLGVPASIVGIMIFAPRLWDALNDPMVGLWSDNCHSRWGRRKPFIFVGAIGLFFSYLMFWCPPFPAGSNVALSIWLLAAGMMLYTFYTVFHIPYFALGFEMSLDYNERTKIQSARMLCAQVAELFRLFMPHVGGFFILGFVFLFGGEYFVASERMKFTVGGIVFAFLLLGIGLFVAFAAKERYGARAAAGIPFWHAFKETIVNRLYVRIILFQVLFLMGLYFIATTIIYLMMVYMQESALPGLTNICTGINVMIWIVIWNYLSPILGKVWSLRIGTLCLIAAGVGAYFVYAPGHFWRPFLFSFIWAPGWSAYTVMVPSIVGDLTDIDELQTGHRREGSYASVMGFMTKLALTGVTIPIGLVVDFLVKFDPALGPDQLPGTWERMKFYTAAVPCLLSVLAFLVLLKFPLTKARMNEVHQALAQRRSAAK